MIEPRARELLQRPGLACVICTLRADGSPQANAVWFRLDGERIYIWTDEERRWVANVKRDPRVAFDVHDNAPPWTSVSIRGRARLDGGDPDEQIRRICERYLPPEEVDAYIAAWPQTRSIVTIEPARVFVTGAFEDPVGHRRT